MSDKNYMQMLRKGKNANSKEAILYAYDMQAGSYARALEDEDIKYECIENEKLIKLSYKEILAKKNTYISSFIRQLLGGELANKSLLEAGVGEGTNLSFLAANLKGLSFAGFDISPSRVKVAREFLKGKGLSVSLCVAGMDALPYPDNSFDIVYTHHALEPNTKTAKKLIKELYRVSAKYLLMVEPSFGLGNDKTKANITLHKYVKNFPQEIKKARLKPSLIKLCELTQEHNQSAYHLVEKQSKKSEYFIACPACKSALKRSEQLFCPSCFLVYPVIKGLDFLRLEDGIFYHLYEKS